MIPIKPVCEFLAYSDIHHDEYSNGLLLEDTISVEDHITEYAYNNHINTVIFAGDLYRATNPLQSVINAVGAAWKRRSDLGIRTFTIPGNHDRWTRSANSGHAFEIANTFKSDLKNVVVFDKVTLTQIDNINFLFIPTWHEHKLPTIPQGKLVVIFHGMVTGSKLPSGKSINGSIDVELLKNTNATIILGGDNHVPQCIFQNCFYLGASLQHNWGDKDQDRGFWHVQIHDHGPTITVIPTRSPRFIKITTSAINEMDAVCKISEVLAERSRGCPSIVEVTIIGNGNINREFIEQNVFEMGARRVTIIIDRSFERTEIIPAVAKATTFEDKWAAYVSSGIAPSMDDLDPKILTNIGLEAINEAKKG